MARALSLDSGHEVLVDPTYLKVCRGTLAFRLLACALTAALTPTEHSLAAGALAGVTAISAWGMLADSFVRLYFRHPALAAVDVTLVMVVMIVEWPVTGALLITALTALLLGLALTPWLGMPGLVLILGTISIAAGWKDAGEDTDVLLLLVGLPVCVLGMTILGWTVRYAFVELRASRDRFMAELVRREHQEERQRLAREMHDSLGKTVNGIGLAAAALATAAERGQLETLQGLGSDIQAAARVAAEESRSVLLGLRRHQDDRPIAEQLGDLTRSKATDRLTVRLLVTGVADLPRELGAEVLALAEEALENVVRHAAASTAVVQLTAAPEGLRLQVDDDGKGFSVRAVRPVRELQGHFGLRGLEERAALHDGVVTISSRAGHGTSVVVLWPTEITSEEKARVQP